MISAIAIVYAITELQNRIREANGFGPARVPARPARHITPTPKRDRRFGLRTPAARPSRA
jgi:hypothetical protein